MDLYLKGWEAGTPEYATLVTNEYNYSYYSHHGRRDVVNLSTSIFLINDRVRAVNVVWSEDDQRNNRTAERKLCKTFDKTIKEGDFVVIPWPTGFGRMILAKVSEVDVDVDFDSVTFVPWIVCRVDMAEFESIVEQENVAAKVIQKANFAAKKRKLAADLESSRELLALPLVNRKGIDD